MATTLSPAVRGYVLAIVIVGTIAAIAYGLSKRSDRAQIKTRYDATLRNLSQA